MTPITPTLPTTLDLADLRLSFPAQLVLCLGVYLVALGGIYGAFAADRTEETIDATIHRPSRLMAQSTGLHGTGNASDTWLMDIEIGVPGLSN